MEEWDSYFRVVYEIYVTIHNSLAAAAYAYFCVPFAAKKRYAIATGVIYFVSISIMFIIPVEISNFVAYGASIIAGIAVLCILDRTRMLQKIFLAVTFFTVRWLTAAVKNCFLVWGHQCSVDLERYSQSVEYQFMVYLMQSIVDCIVSGLIIFGIVWIIRRAYKYNMENMTIKEFVLMILPSMSGMVGYAMLKMYDHMYWEDKGYDLSEVSGSFNMLSMCYYLASIITIVVMIVFFQSIKEKQEEMRQNELLCSQITSMKQHIGEVERLYSEIRGLRHDMGNHVMILESLYSTGEHTAADEYMTALKSTLISQEYEMKSGNPVTDVILLERRRKAQEKGIEFLCQFHYPQHAHMNVFDVSIILSNALDNAIKAAQVVQKEKGKAIIYIGSYTKNNMYMIEINNSVAGEMEWDRDGLPVSTLNKKEGHGYGLLNMKRVAQKYYGDISAECKDGIFRLNIMMVMTAKEQDN